MINQIAPPGVAHYRQLARLGQALASPVRLQLVDLLRQGERSVEALADAAGVSVANASRHLQLMRSARLVTAARHGRHVRYRLSGAEVSGAFGSLRSLAETLLPEMEGLRRQAGALTAHQRAEVLEEIRRGASTLLDVRPAEEYAAGHLPGARSIPLEELPARLGEVPRHQPVVAYCRGPYCPLGAGAVALLTAAGYRARHLDLGVPDLEPTGLPYPRNARPRPRRAST